MEIREKVIEFEPDRTEAETYAIYDSADEGTRIQLLYRENRAKQVRTIEAVNIDCDTGYDCDIWFADVKTIVEEYLPPNLSFSQFVHKLAVAMELLPDVTEEEEDDTPAWSGPILRQIVAALQEAKH